MAHLQPPHTERAARPHRARQLLDADLHQLAAPGAVRPRVVAGLPRRRDDRHRRTHAGVFVRARHRGRPAGDHGARDRLSGCVDNDYAVWSAFDNHFWPALYFIDRDGTIRDDHFGEGRYEKSERTIQRLLDVDCEFVPVEGAGVEAQADWPQLATPETYLGYARGERLATMGEPALDEPRDYELPEHLRANQWGLAGEWIIGRENVALQRTGGSITFRFHARDAHLVLSPGGRDPIPFRVFLDGERPGASHGLDVDGDGSGQLRDGRLYQLVRQRGPVRERTLTITFLDGGAEAYAFTFG